MLRSLTIAFIVVSAVASAAIAADTCCPVPQPEVAQATLPQGHPPLPAGHPSLPAGHPPTTQPATTQPTTQPAVAVGTIAVRAVVGTPGMQPPAGARVILNLIHGQKTIKRLETALDIHGIIVFEDVELVGPVTPQVVIMHRGIGYQGVGQPMHAGNTSQQVDVKIFDVTTEKPAWTIAMRHLMISPDESGITVSDVYVINNPTDRTWIADDHDGHDHPTLILSLPPGAQQINPAGGFFPSQTQVKDGQVFTSTPVMPGKSQFALVYQIPSVAGNVSLPIYTPATTQTTKVFLPVGDAGVQVSGLTDEGVKEMGTTRVRVLSAIDLKQGHAASLTIGGFAISATSQPGAAAPPSQAPQVIAGVGVLGALFAGLVMMLVKKPAKKA